MRSSPRVAGAACGGGAVAGGAAFAAALSVTRVRITAPCDTLSPTLTFSSSTTPPSGAGTSIVALSDSSVTSGSSGFTLSPGLTSTSMTGTSLKSPMSGTRTSATPAGALAAAGGACTDGTGGGSAAGGAPPPSSSRMTLPSLTLSPTLTFSCLTVPAAGAGTSIVALSDSRVTSGSSGLTLSPALTRISMTGTSLKSPISGTLTSAMAPMSPPVVYTVQGSGRSVSSPYFLIASSALSLLISPSSASAFSAATRT